MRRCSDAPVRAEAQPRASFHLMPDTPLDPDWRPAVTIDLDGDGRAVAHMMCGERN
jgi:hypothetical protein